MDFIEISMLDDGDFFVHSDDEYYVYHTADEIIDMVMNNSNIQLDIDKLSHDLRKMCFKYGYKLK